MFNILYFILCYIVLSCTALRCDNPAHKRSAPGGILTWPKNTVPYEIDEDYSPDEKELILDSLKDITEKTDNCVMFVPRTDAHSNWVSVGNGTGCWSLIGMFDIAGPQPLSLDRSGCMTRGIVQHEFLHALGFIHEQTRPDRDAYVKILYENVEPKKKHNFDKDPHGILQSVGFPYDYNSIMHYGYKDFSTNCLPIIVTVQKDAKQWRYQMGTGAKLTTVDISKVKKIYGCDLPDKNMTFSGISSFAHSSYSISMLFSVLISLSFSLICKHLYQGWP